MTHTGTHGKKKKKSRFSVGHILLALAVLLICGTIIALVSVCLFTEPIDTSLMAIKMSSQVYYVNDAGEEVILQNLYDEENRTWVDYADIPVDMKNAIVAIEDERFFSHPGFDLKRTIAAGGNAVLRLVKKNRSVYGGSTITQQLVKNLTGEDDRTILRKVQEIYRAVRLERELSKDEILEWYLNTLYLSQNCNGVATASRVYFSKDVSDLSLAECASIAGITQYPSLYDPYLNPDENKKKQLVVLDKMLELEMITQEQHDTAASEELHFRRDEHVGGAVYSYFLDTVIEEIMPYLVEQYGSETLANRMLYSGGLKIRCTMDPTIQAQLEAVYTDPSNITVTASGETLQSAMVVVESSTGAIRGIVGGVGEKTGSRTFNRATALRQPGSTMKPIGVYAPSLEYGVISPAVMIDDVTTTFDVPGGAPWVLKGSRGLVPLETAIASSLNVPAAKTLEKLGVDVSYDFLTRNLGVTSLVDHRATEGGVVSDRSLAALSLGGLTDGISPIELAGAYLPFSNNGSYIRPHSFDAVYSYKDELLFTPHAEAHQAMRSGVAAIMTNLLRGVVTSGTGTAAYFPGVELAGKTGSTDNDFDRWFVGYTPAYVGVTWVGYDSPHAIYSYGNPAIPFWRAVMSGIDHTGRPTSFSETLDYGALTYRTLCSVSGKLATDRCYVHGTVRSVMAEKDSSALGYCDGSEHSNYVYTPPAESEETEGEEGAEGAEGAEGTEGAEHDLGGGGGGAAGEAGAGGEAPVIEVTPPAPVVVEEIA